jgi:quinone-modifying oxidoreductase subunit QmoC
MATLVRPDRAFVRQVVAAGGGSVKQCMQCATCSIACSLSNDSSPFPRKELLWAQWGLADRLMADPDVWRCHQCDDCSTRCPRGARPGDVLAAIRQLVVRHYAVPRFLADWIRRPRFIPVLLGIPALLIGLTLIGRGPLESALGFEEHSAFYAAFFPHWLLISFFSLFTGLAALAAVVGAARFWGAMRAADRAAGRRPNGGLWPALRGTLKSIVTHDRFAECTARAPRRTAHLLAFYGFAALFAVTVWAVLDLYVNPLIGIASRYPFAPLHPMKLLANVGAVALVAGSGKALLDRRAVVRAGGANTAFDWTFAWLLLLVGVTGLATELLRLWAEPTDVPALDSAAYATYFFHLVLVFALLVYLPYSKFAHLLYRTVALVYAQYAGRDHGVRGRSQALLRSA